MSKAAEIIRSRQGKTGLTERFPWVVAFTFGLLHGLGFASALSEVGLPQSAIPVALLFFNVGVELGQLLFVASVFAVIALGDHTVRPFWRSTLNPELSTRLRLLPAYAIGSVAMFWVIQRISTSEPVKHRKTEEWKHHANETCSEAAVCPISRPLAASSRSRRVRGLSGYTRKAGSNQPITPFSEAGVARSNRAQVTST